MDQLVFPILPATTLVVLASFSQRCQRSLEHFKPWINSCNYQYHWNKLLINGAQIRQILLGHGAGNGALLRVAGATTDFWWTGGIALPGSTVVVVICLGRARGSELWPTPAKWRNKSGMWRKNPGGRSSIGDGGKQEKPKCSLLVSDYFVESNLKNLQQWGTGTCRYCGKNWLANYGSFSKRATRLQSVTLFVGDPSIPCLVEYTWSSI